MQRSRGWLRGWLGVGSSAWLVGTIILGCAPADKTTSALATFKNANVLVILVDTLRADRLGFGGYPRPTSPNLDRFAEQAIVFTEARSQAGCTYPSINSLLTSRYPYRFMGQDEARMAIPADLPTLPEVLRRGGYATAAVSASGIVRATPSPINPVGGFGAGFETFDESCLNEDASCVNERAFGLLGELPSPFFLYLHYMDPHAPYQPPASYQRRFAQGAIEARRWAREGNTMPLIRKIYDGRDEIEVSGADIEEMRALYDDEIRYLDGQLARLFEHLEQSGLSDSTIVILASDHGEELMEHDEISHCRSLVYDTVIHTPLVVRLPSGGIGGKTSGRLAVGAQNLDIAPTILDLVGLEAPPGFEGRSLLRTFETPSSRPVNRYQFALQGTARAISDGSLKLIYDLETLDSELFDLTDDPGESTDVSAGRLADVERLGRVLFAWIEAMEGSVGSERSLRDAEESEKKLKALGYL